MKAGRQTSRNASGGFNLFEAKVVTCILGVLIAICLPVLMKPRERYRCRINCTNNLKQIGLSFKQWALDNDDKYPMQVSVINGGTQELIASGNVYANFLVMSNELNTPKILFCPAEANPKRVVATTFANAIPPGVTGQIPFTNNNNISYFVGADAVDAAPQMFLSGDDNLALGRRWLGRGPIELGTNSPIAWTSQRHTNRGNILLVDGSVQYLSSAGLRAALAATGVATNRLLLP